MNIHKEEVLLFVKLFSPDVRLGACALSWSLIFFG